ncbi:hypothetical protein CRE_28931 [Caenorhabditis remanei]|uniref:DUF38 domain-containing protein n=1 Tax=Caenorhabditis remanei TaxID=31234 RepID=E3N5A5_CAERE|nr:hypothetical protein CRE_28931 [Caenorhabditis remanei]
MPIVYDHIITRDKRPPTGIRFAFNDQKTQGIILHPTVLVTPTYEHVGGSAGVSTVVTIDLRDYLVDDNFISVVCEDVEAFVRHQTEELTRFYLTTYPNTDGDQKMLKTIINRMCRCLENSLQSRVHKLKVKHFSLSVLEISQAVSAVNLLDREILQTVTVHLPFEDQVFTAEDFIPLIEGQGRQRLDLRIQLYEFSLQVLEEVKKLLTFTSQLNWIHINYKTIDEKCIELIPKANHQKKLLTSTSQFNCIHINYKTIDEKCIELIPGAYHCPDQKKVIFPINHADDPIKEMAMVSRYILLEKTIIRFQFTLSDNNCLVNIFEDPLIMRSIASNLEFSQMYAYLKILSIDEQPFSLNCFEKCPEESVTAVIIEGMINGLTCGGYKGFLEQEAARIVNDFDLNTRHQKSRMNELCIDCNIKEEDDPALSKFFKLLRNVLIYRKSPLKVKQLKLFAHWQCLVMNILPYLDAEYLECIIILMFENDKEYTIDLEEISKTEQWSKAKVLQITNLTVRMSIQEMNILNFERIDITLETMSQVDITYCRKNLPQSPVIEKFKIHIKNCLAADFLASLGEPYRVVNNLKYIWYFRMENTQDYLHVTLEQIPLQTGRRLQFAKILQEDTPFF